MTMERNEIIAYLSAAIGSPLEAELFARAARVKAELVGPKVYLRGLVEYSNRCVKNCLYCGIRCANGEVDRYELTDQEVMRAARYALEQGYGSVVLQAGERSDSAFVGRIERLVGQIAALREVGSETSEGMGITLSLGEQSFETYRRWREAGATRYLLRIESSTRELYERIHPADHSFDRRIEALANIRRAGLQLGTGVMIGLPFQSVEHLADDLLFMRTLDVDMCGMGPYIEHPDAPLSACASDFTLDERYALALRMIALLRILMPTINIASTTALHAIRPRGREAGIAAGANVIMPNLSPAEVRGGYKLYNNKPLADMDLSGFDIAYSERGDSLHWAKNRNKSK